MADTPRPGIAASLRRLLDSGLATAQVRLELLAVEVQEERLRLATLLLTTVLSALLIGFGLLFLALFLTVLYWDEHRLLALGTSAAIFLGGGLYSASTAARTLRQGSQLFSASLAELARDRDAVARDE